MTQDAAEFIANNVNGAEVYEEYSGRGMYGKTTTGVTVSSELRVIEGLMNIVKEMAEDEDLEGLQNLPDFKNLRVDNMGQDIIIY